MHTRLHDAIPEATAASLVPVVAAVRELKAELSTMREEMRADREGVVQLRGEVAQLQGALASAVEASTAAVLECVATRTKGVRADVRALADEAGRTAAAAATWQGATARRLDDLGKQLDTVAAAARAAAAACTCLARAPWCRCLAHVPMSARASSCSQPHPATPCRCTWPARMAAARLAARTDAFADRDGCGRRRGGPRAHRAAGGGHGRRGRAALDHERGGGAAGGRRRVPKRRLWLQLRGLQDERVPPRLRVAAQPGLGAEELDLLPVQRQNVDALQGEGLSGQGTRERTGWRDGRTEEGGQGELRAGQAGGSGEGRRLVQVQGREAERRRGGEEQGAGRLPTAPRARPSVPGR